MTDSCTDTPETLSPQMATLRISNGLRLELAPFGLERVRDYKPGGLHPIHLGDLLHHNKRYKVVHKLGNGGFATVWLCRDLESESNKYVALKVLMAHASTEDCPELRVNKLEELLSNDDGSTEHICLPTDHFQIDGPNGQHRCFVYPVLGPKASMIVRKSEDPDADLRRVAHQAVQALAALHKHGICHGDFTPANILVKLSGLQGLTEQEVVDKLQEPWRNPVLAASGESCNEPTAPRYLVYPIDFNVVGEDLITDNASVTDFGESFEINSPPKDLGIPQRYQSPEYLLNQQVGVESDLWALGCTLFHIRTGGQLFDPFDDEVDEILCSQVLRLGKMPESLWTTWASRQYYFEDDADAQGRAVKQTASDLNFQYEDRSIVGALSRGLSCFPPMGSRADGFSRDIPEKEVELLADLLEKILKWNPSERLSTEEVLKHAWFTM